MITVIEWLEAFCSSEDLIPGACYVGENRGTDHSNWQIYDREALREFIEHC